MVQEVRAKRPRSRRVSVVLIESTSRDNSSDAETIYSAQGYETIAVVDDNESSDSEKLDVTLEATEFDVYDVEYEPDDNSCDEKEGSSGIKKSNGDSSCDDSDIEDIRIVDAAVALIEIESSSKGNCGIFGDLSPVAKREFFRQRQKEEE